MVFVVSSFQVFEKNSIVESKQRIVEFLSKSFSIEIREINVEQKKKKGIFAAAHNCKRK